MGVIDIKSVYDFDGVDTADAEHPDPRGSGATPAATRPARFVRITKAVSLPDKTS